MEILNILLAALVSLSGLFVGLITAKIAKEELKAGKLYFQITQSILLLFAMLSVLYYFELHIGIFIILSIIIILLSIRINPKAIISYIIFTLLFLISLENASLFILINSLIFLYGFPTGALIVQRGFKNYMKEEIENPISTGYLSKIMQKTKYALWVTMLEIISIPALFMKKKESALYHLKYVCPLCPSSRRKHRDVHGKSNCWWEYNWLKGKYTIPRHFGITNWIRQYTHFGTNLKKFKNTK